MAKRIALYVRVSTDSQTVDNQRTELDAWAVRCGHIVAKVYQDEGISGAKGRDKRPGLDAMLKDANRRQFDQVAVWAVDRLGRSMSDLVRTLDDLKAAGIDLYLHGQGLDTSTPTGKALFGMLGVFAEFERSMIVARVKAGLERAKATGTRTGNPFGRPVLSTRKTEIARTALANGASVRAAAKLAGISKSAAGKLAKAA
jgi:DNA invertase Pin-like site-specific DNA recombinase